MMQPPTCRSARTISEIIRALLPYDHPDMGTALFFIILFDIQLRRYIYFI